MRVGWSETDPTNVLVCPCLIPSYGYLFVSSSTPSRTAAYDCLVVEFQICVRTMVNAAIVFDLMFFVAGSCCTRLKFLYLQLHPAKSLYRVSKTDFETPAILKVL